MHDRQTWMEAKKSFKSWSSGLWYCVVMWQDTNILEGNVENIDDMVYCKTSILLYHYMVSQPRGPWHEYSLLWKPQMLQHITGLENGGRGMKT
jgi:hypothetical protein